MDEIDPGRIIEEPEIPRKAGLMLLIVCGLIAIGMGVALWSTRWTSDLAPSTTPAAPTTRNLTS